MGGLAKRPGLASAPAWRARPGPLRPASAACRSWPRRAVPPTCRYQPPQALSPAACTAWTAGPARPMSALPPSPTRGRLLTPPHKTVHRAHACVHPLHKRAAWQPRPAARLVAHTRTAEPGRALPMPVTDVLPPTSRRESPMPLQETQTIERATGMPVAVRSCLPLPTPSPTRLPASLRQQRARGRPSSCPWRTRV